MFHVKLSYPDRKKLHEIQKCTFKWFKQTFGGAFCFYKYIFTLSFCNSDLYSDALWRF